MQSTKGQHKVLWTRIEIQNPFGEGKGQEEPISEGRGEAELFGEGRGEGRGRRQEHGRIRCCSRG